MEICVENCQDSNSNYFQSVKIFKIQVQHFSSLSFIGIFLTVTPSHQNLWHLICMKCSEANLGCVFSSNGNSQPHKLLSRTRDFAISFLTSHQRAHILLAIYLNLKSERSRAIILLAFLIITKCTKELVQRQRMKKITFSTQSKCDESENSGAAVGDLIIASIWRGGT